MGVNVTHTALRICFFVALLAAMVVWARPGPGLYGPEEAGAAFPGLNGKIVFASDRDGDFEIYVMNADGSGQAQLTTNTAFDRFPDWSADGSKIAFQSGRDGNNEVYTMNADGSGQTNRTNNGAFDGNPAWSRDGLQIAFQSARTGNNEIYTMNADGTGQTNRTNDGGTDLAPDWSRDGKIVFSSDRAAHAGNFEIYTMNADGTGQTRLTNDGASDSEPDWSADGSKITFSSNRVPHAGNFEIYTMNADGTSPTRVTNNGATDGQPAWSPDGSKIAFRSDRDGDFEVYVMNADGSGVPTQLTTNLPPAVDDGPDWQPTNSPSGGTFLYALDTPNPQANANFGWSAAAGDVDGDGKADIVVGAAYYDVGGGAGTPPPTYVDQGRVYVFSGANGSLLRTLNTPNPQTGAKFGWSVAVHDVDFDGKADIVVGAPYENVSGNAAQGRAYVFSGATGGLLQTLDTPTPQVGALFGFSVLVLDDMGDGWVNDGCPAVGPPELVGAQCANALDDDVDGWVNDGCPAIGIPEAACANATDDDPDGYREVAVGAAYEDGVPPATDQGAAYVLSGANGASLFGRLTTSSAQANANFGWLLRAGDLNGDGKRDLVVGAPGDSGQGRVYAFNGTNGNALAYSPIASPNPQAGANFGYSVSVGQIDGLGNEDIAAGAPAEDVGVYNDQGRAYVFSGTDGSLLFTLNKPDPPQQGANFGGVEVGDVNNDGKGDIGVGAVVEDVSGHVDQGRVYVFSGSNQLLIGKNDIPNPQAGAHYAFSGGWADTNGDGRLEGFVGAPYEDVGGNVDQGRVYVYLTGYPPAGTDQMTVSLHFDHLWLDTTVPHDGVPDTDFGSVTLTGQAQFHRDNPGQIGGYETINTEILSMVLHGTVNGNPVTTRAGTFHSLSASLGKIQEQIAGTYFPAESFFDVYFKVDPNPGLGLGEMRNCEVGGVPQPLRLQGVTMHVPVQSVEFTVPGDTVKACEEQVGGGMLPAGEFVPLSPGWTMNGGLGDGVSATGSAAVGGIAEVPGTAAELGSAADSSGGSGFNYTVLGAALGAAAVAVAAGAWLARRRRAR